MVGAPLVTKGHCGPCREQHNAATLRRYEVLKDEVFTAYGGYTCACCRETIPAFLSIDHINDDGADHRRSIGSDLYRWLIKHNFPEGFQVLCMNCQWGKRKHGVCPHQADSSSGISNDTSILRPELSSPRPR